MVRADDSALIEEWLKHLRYTRGRSEATAVKYGNYIRRLSAWVQANDLALLTVRENDLEQFTGLHMHSEGLSPRSRRALVAAVRGFFAWVRREAHRPDDPALALPYPKAGQKLPTSMQLRHAERLLMQPDISTFIGIRDAAVLAVLMGCGLRISGVVGLNQSQLIWAEVEGAEWLIVRTYEKGGKERLVPAPHETRLLVRAYLGHSDLEDIDRSLPAGDQVLFVSTRNRTIPPHQYHGEERRLAARTVRDMIVDYGSKAGIPRAELHPHAMRHLYGTELAEDDIDLIMRQALLGHSDASSTQIYTHMATRKLTKVVERSNPLSKVRTPVTDLLRQLQQQV